MLGKQEWKLANQQQAVVVKENFEKLLNIFKETGLIGGYEIEAFPDSSISLNVWKNKKAVKVNQETKKTIIPEDYVAKLKEINEQLGFNQWEKEIFQEEGC